MLDMLSEVYHVFGLTYKLALSTRPEGYLGTLEMWDKAEAALTDALNKTGLPWEVSEIFLTTSAEGLLHAAVYVTTGSILCTLEMCDNAEAVLMDALYKTGLPWAVSATLHSLLMKKVAEWRQPHESRLCEQHMSALRGMLSLRWGTPSVALLNRQPGS